MCFFNRTTHVHIRNLLFVMYNNCLGQEDPQISRPLNTYSVGNVEVGKYSFSRACHKPLPNCDNGYKMLETIYRRMTFVTFMTVCIREYTPTFSSRGIHCVLI